MEALRHVCKMQLFELVNGEKRIVLNFALSTKFNEYHIQLVAPGSRPGRHSPRSGLHSALLFGLANLDNSLGFRVQNLLMRSLDTLHKLQRDDRHEARRLIRVWSKVGVIDQ